MGNPNVKRAGVNQSFTKEEVEEYKKCMKSPAYFARNYVRIIHLDRGLVPFDLYPYQEKMFDHFNKNQFSIVLACRQSGKSISAIVYLLWYAIFHPSKTIAILANKGATAREMLARVALALENLPFFLQPGCKALNKGSIEFDNGSRILAAATSSSSIRGYSINLLFLDEFAFVEKAATFYTSTYPVITGGKSARVIITSTANGVGNVYHKLWESAVQNVSQYKPFRVDWWDVPGRDEKWKKDTISNTSQLQFEQEFGNSFHGTGSTLINAETLLSLKAQSPIFTQNDVKVFRRPVPKHQYVMTVDVGRGKCQDYSTFAVVDVSIKPFQIAAVFRNNRISPLLLPDIVYKFARIYNDAYVLVESNDNGSVVCNGLYYDLEYENMFVESSIKADAIGVLMTKKTKRIGCSNLKDLIETKKLEICESETIIELSTFEANGASYEASEGNHDDLVMNLVLFAWFAATDQFAQMANVDLKTMLYAERLRQVEDDITPVGVFSTVEDEADHRFVAGGDTWIVAMSG